MRNTFPQHQPKFRAKEDGISTQPCQPFVFRLCCFFALVITAGLVAVYSINMGTEFLEKHDAPTRPEVAQSRRSLAREPSATTISIASLVGNGGGQNLKTSIDDLAVAVITDQGHEVYTTYSRAWRQGIKTYVGTNHTVSPWLKKFNEEAYNEVWGFYPDDKPLHTLALKGDSRAALAPFLAFRDLGETFKWLLYGDDDTFFFTDAVLKAVDGLDPHMPYFLTDHMWWTEKWVDENGNPGEETHHPHKSAPLCVPCNYRKNTSPLAFPHPRGCPCYTSILCAADQKGVFFKGPANQCGVPRVPIRTFSMHGGAGAIISVGLLKAIPFRQFEDCVTTTYSTAHELSLLQRHLIPPVSKTLGLIPEPGFAGGDAVISICLWQAGYGMTSPDPLWHPKGKHMFDIGDEGQGDSDDIIARVARPMANLLQAAAGFCDTEACKLELDHFVTLHMRSRKFPSKACFAEISRTLSVLGHVAYGRMSLTQLTPEGQIEDFMDQQIKLAIGALQQWMACQGKDAQGAGEGSAGCKQADGIAESDSNRYARILQSSTSESAAFDLGQELVNQAFQRFPSPTGSYGEIPIGRE